MSDALKSLMSAGSPFEMATQADGTRTFRFAPRTLPELYARARKRPQDATVLVDGEHRIALGELFRAARGIHRLVTPHRALPRRVAVWLPDGPLLAAALIGITEAGSAAVLVPCNTEASRVADLLHLTECEVLLASAAVESLCGDSLAVGVVVSWEAALQAGSAGNQESEAVGGVDGDGPPGPADPALVAFTSGSSGSPKAVVISHRALLTGLWNMMLASAWTARRNRQLEGGAAIPLPGGGAPCSLVAAPLTHVGGYTQLLLALAVSVRVVLLSRWDARQAAELARREGATTLIGATPPMIKELLDVAREADQPLPLNSFGIHGAAFRRSLMEEIGRRVPGARFSTGYGMTETSGSIAATSGAEFLSRPDTCGPVLPTVDIEVIDANGLPQPPGLPGEIRVRGAMLFSGYLQRCDAPAAPGDSTDWLRTGDIGVLDQEGFLTLLERHADSIRLGTRGIHCADIEKYLDQKSYGDEVVAVGIESGQRLLVGIVSPRKDVDAGDLKRDLKEEFEVPRDWITVICRPDLPRTASGKIDRRALVRMAAGMQPQGNAWHAAATTGNQSRRF